MRIKFLHIILGFILTFSTTISYSQINVEEENDLKFQTYFFEALKQKAINNYGKAIENLEQCNAIKANDKAVEFELSKNYFLLKKNFEAHSFIDLALEKEVDNVFMLKHKVAIFKAERNFKEAIEIQKKIVELKSNYSDELVMLYAQNKEYKKAELLISDIEKNGLTTTRLRGLKKYLSSRNMLQNLNKRVEDAKENLNLEELRAEYAKKKEYKTLVEILEKEIETEQFEKAYLNSKQALELFPSQAYLYKTNGLALNKLGKYSEAIAVLSIGIDFVIANNNLEADFYDQLSIAYKGEKNDKEALKFKLKADKIRERK
jgi:predicted Zn-dependent protease